MESWETASLQVEPHRPQVLRSDEETRAIAIHLPAGEQLQEHQVHERCYMFVVSGEVAIEHGGEALTGQSGLLVHFEPNERRTVTAMSDTRLVLVLAPWPGIGHPSRRD